MAKDPKRVAAGKKSKRKGNSNERKLAKQFKDWWGHGEWAKTPSSGGWATKSVREEFRTCGDIITTATDFPFCVEAKHQESWELVQLLTAPSSAIFKFWEQTVEETPEGLLPLLTIRRNHREPLAVLNTRELDQFLTPLSLREYGINCLQLVDIVHSLTILTLKDFLSLKPDLFGRKLPDE